MRWNRRLMVTSSTVTVLALAGSVLLLVKPDIIGNRMPVKAVSVEPVLTGPVTSSEGRPLTVTRPQKALVINPAQISPKRRKLLARKIGERRLGTKPTLWLAPSAARRAFQGEAGVWSVTAEVIEPKPGISAPMVDSIATLAGDVSREPWVFSHGTYHLARTKRVIHTSIQTGLTRALDNNIQGNGSIVVADAHGMIEAMVGEGTGSLWRSHAVNLALLPPLLALALNSSAVRHVLAQGAIPLKQIGQVWGTNALRQGLLALGMGQPSLSRSPKELSQVPTHPVPSTLSQGTGLFATPEELARSYLPFVDQGQVPPLAIEPKLGHTPALAGMFSETLQQMPAIKQNGVTFRVWRPQGSYAVILAPAQKRVAVLEGAAVVNTLAVMQILAQDRP